MRHSLVHRIEAAAVIGLMAFVAAMTVLGAMWTVTEQ